LSDILRNRLAIGILVGAEVKANECWNRRIRWKRGTRLSGWKVI
jgi:hypothetical protein